MFTPMPIPTSAPPFGAYSRQIDDLLAEIRDRAKNNQRVLVTTLTKRMSETSPVTTPK
ncbi:MAG: hypothetical protein QOJ42_6153 [Acidobacteriaceae bacterium]|jgi:excinuclease UvrABC helicase subunit UvrB|nr:hypothetical protein [Acidobacteriaceae bacterium]